MKSRWEHANNVKGSYKYVMDDEYFYYYHVAHMARHFVDGGCGVRPYLDLWLLNNKIVFCKNIRYSLLEKGALLKFALASEFLLSVWMGEKEHIIESQLMEKYILSGGVYGNKENKVAIQQAKTGGRLKFVFSRIFRPIEELQHRYKILKKHKYLYPIMLIRRCVEVLLKGDSKRIRQELQTSEGFSSEEQRKSKQLIEYLGLK